MFILPMFYYSHILLRADKCTAEDPGKCSVTICSYLEEQSPYFG